jgi:hypothetical protein
MRADVLVTPAACPASCAAGYGSKTAEANPADSGRSYSSVWNNDAPGTSHARSTIDGPQAWSAEQRSSQPHYDAEPWMEMDAGAEKSIVAVRVQGRRNSNQYVQTYKVQVNGEFLEAAGGGEIFTSTSTGDAISTAMLAQPIQARFVRIYPQTYTNHMSMRAGLVTGGDLCITQLHENRECSAQSKNLGNMASPAACAAAAEEHESCAGSFMFSGSYKSWGCRCCKAGATDGVSHSHWDVYEYDTTMQIGSPPAYTGRNCAAQTKNLGTFGSYTQCIATAKGDSACHGSVMFSGSYNSWGCRCCAAGEGGTGVANNNWDIYSY